MSACVRPRHRYPRERLGPFPFVRLATRPPARRACLPRTALGLLTQLSLASARIAFELRHASVAMT